MTQDTAPLKRTKFSAYTIAIAAFLGMGMSVPSCPGQQEMKDQMSALQTENGNLKKQVAAMDGQVKTLSTEMGQVKQLLKPMADAIQAQKAAMDQLDANLREIQAKMAKPAPKAAAKPAAKATHPAAKKRK